MFYAENVEFRSPKIKVVLYPDKTNATIYNRKDLEEHFFLGLKSSQNCIFTPIDFIVKGNNILLEYQSLQDNKIKWSVIELKDELIVKSSVFYGIENVV